VKFRKSSTFKEDFGKLPASIQKRTREKFGQFKEDMRHPSLRIKKMKGYGDIWEGHITDQYVFTFEFGIDPDTGESLVIFRRIGTHSVYEKP